MKATEEKEMKQVYEVWKHVGTPEQDGSGRCVIRRSDAQMSDAWALVAIEESMEMAKATCKRYEVTK